MTAPISASEQTPAARLGARLFRNRSWLPVPFLLVPLLASGTPSRDTWIIGGVLVLLGELVRVATVTRRRSREVQRLVTYGAFAWCRNPLYVGNFLAWMGFTVISGVLWFLPVAAVLFAVEYSLIVRYEEGVLESIFGEEYLAYKDRTPRWIGRPPAERTSGEHNWGEALWSERSTVLQYVALTALFWFKGRGWGL